MKQETAKRHLVHLANAHWMRFFPLHLIKMIHLSEALLDTDKYILTEICFS